MPWPYAMRSNGADAHVHRCGRVAVFQAALADTDHRRVPCRASGHARQRTRSNVDVDVDGVHLRYAPPREQRFCAAVAGCHVSVAVPSRMMKPNAVPFTHAESAGRDIVTDNVTESVTT